MRLAGLHLLIAAYSLALATGCQTAHRPAILLLAPQASAPAIPAETGPAPRAATPAVPQATPEVRSAPPQPKSDPVANLVSAVEKEYLAGQASAWADNPEAAKASFDRAMSLLTESKLDVHSDARLELEYNKVVAAENNLNLVGSPQSESAPAQQPEPAPIDEVNEATPAVDPNVKAKAEAEMMATRSDLPLMLTDPVAGYINYFSNRGHEQLEHALIRSGRYQDMIQHILKEENVPQELIYLALAESGFHPLALSRAGARGMWQFMGLRAKGYGLKRSPWVDERQDPEKATRAAARHLKDLYKEFGDWYLAMAAYNSGPGGVQQAVKRTGYADFWELYKRNVLPKETRNYVPIILAATIMAKNRAQYGLDQLVLDPPLAYDTVPLDYQVDLRLVSQCVDAPLSTLQELNPSLLRWTTPKDSAFDLHLPVGSADKYSTAIAAIPRDMRVWWRYHTVAQGDTPAALARAYRSTLQAILDVNHLKVSELQPESKLIIPIAPGKHATSEDDQTYARRLTRYRVHLGDTVQSVADDFGVPASLLRRWNHLKGDSLRGRRVVYVHLPVPVGRQGGQPAASRRTRKTSSKSNPNKTLARNGNTGARAVVRHTVKAGETLYSIASDYKTTVSAIQRDNGLVDVASVRPGMILVIHDLH
jgi:membrane-bound lytic murein transglycosylase D